MKHLKIIYALSVAVIMSLVIYSCAKEDSKSKVEFKALANEEFNQIVNKSFQSLGVQKDNSIVDFRSTNTNCPPATPAPGTTCSTTSATHTISLPASGSRPACNDMKLTYLLTVCYNPNPAPFESPISFTFESFEAWPGNCPAFLTWYNNLSNIDKAIQQDKWEYEASRIEEELLVVSILTQAGFFGCEHGWSASSSFNTNLCYSRCLVPTDGWPYWKSTKSYCGIQCCKRKTEYCLGITGAVQYQGPTFETVGPSCEFSTVFCPKGGIPLSEFCGVKCGPL